MFKKEWSVIRKTPMTIVTIVALALVASLYNIIFTKSMWEPYKQISHLPVAIVNQDKSATLDGKTVTIGDDLEKTMKKTKSLDYHFVSSRKAEKGLENGDYYMVVTFPKKLSENATSLLTNHPKKMTIKYQTTKGRNFIAYKMSDSAVTALKAKVSTNITQTYTEALLKQMTKLKTGMSDASDASQKLADGSQQLYTGSKSLESGLGQLSTATNTLSTGASDLSTGISQYTNGVSSLTQGTNALNTKSSQLVSGVSQLTNSSKDIQTLTDGANQLSQGLQSLSNQTGLSDSQKTQLTQLESGLTQLNSAIQTYQSSAQSSASSLTASLTAITTSANQIKQEASATKQASIAAVQATSTYQGLSASAQQEIVSAIQNASSPVSQEADTILSEASSLQTSLTAMQTQTQSALSQLSQSSNTVLPAAANSLSTLSSGLTTVHSALSSQVVPASQQVANGVSTLNAQLSSGANTLLNGVTAYTNAVSQINQGANQLNANSTALVSGANQLQDGASQMASGSSQLVTGSQSLTNGLSSLSTGSDSLANALDGASTQLQLVETKPKNATLLAKPVKTKHKDKDNSPVNGYGMVPYMVGAALFVACISTNLLVGAAKPISGERPNSRLGWLAWKLSVNGVIAVAQAIILYGALHLIGLHPNHELGLFAVILASSCAFMAIVTALTTLNERVGSALSLILLLLQLASSAGAYPIELTYKFYQVVNPFLPMTYTILGLRKSISMTNHIGFDLLVLVLVTIVFMILGMLFYNKDKKIA